MLQYIINASAIWLLSLIVFDIFLSKETYHTYNRFYLLGSFILGLLIPLYRIQEASVQYATYVSRPLAEGTLAIEDGIATADTSATVVSIPAILFAVYVSGVLFFLALLIKEAVSLVQQYKRGNKFKDGIWTIIETNKQHTPYSAFRYVFISSKANYSPDQLRIILDHEEQHGQLYHFLDLVLMQLAKTALWFHPLVYIYSNRLSVVHEYQADAASAKEPAVYGRFLIEQAILKNAPALSHSFNRSPIKKRIVMLTRNSSTLSKAKMLLVLPLVLVCALYFSKNAFGDDIRIKKGNLVTYRGNTIEFDKKKSYTTSVYQSKTGKPEVRLIEREPDPVKLNGKQIYTAHDVDINNPGKYPNQPNGYVDDDIKEYLLANLTTELKQLKDGKYYLGIDHIIIDENGRIAYFDYAGITTDKNKTMLTDANAPKKDIQDMFAKKISTLLNEAEQRNGAVVKDIKVPSILDKDAFNRPFKVKNGQFSL